jgi:hypothetical protein
LPGFHLKLELAYQFLGQPASPFSNTVGARPFGRLVVWSGQTTAAV